MKGKDIKRIINEEIHEYEYLTHDSIKEEDNLDATLNSKEFQTGMVRDTINGRLKWSLEEDSTGEPEDDGWGSTVIKNLYKDLRTLYNFNNQPYELTVIVEGENLPVEEIGQQMPATQLQPEENPEPNRVQYGYNTDVALFDDSGREIPIVWLNKNSKLKDQFITSMIGALPY